MISLFVSIMLFANLYSVEQYGDVFESADAGASWSYKGNAGASNCVAITTNNTNLYVITSDGDVSKSTDAVGASWAAPKNCGLSEIVGAQYNNGVLFVVSEKGTIARISDSDWGSNDWFYSTCGQSGVKCITALQGRILFVATCSGEIFKSTDVGVSWGSGPISNIHQTGICGLTSTFDDKLWIVTETAEFATSTDTGETWSSLTNTGLNACDVVDIVSDNLDNVFIFSSSSGVAKYSAKGWLWKGNTGQVGIAGAVGKESAPLASGIIGFTGVPGDSRVKLMWLVASECKINKYVIERKDYADFHKITTVPARGDKEYEYIDKGLTNKKTYFYRLGSLDAHNVITYYATISVTPVANPLAWLSLTAYPNPFMDKLNVRCVRVEIHSNRGPKFGITHIGPFRLRVYDYTGRFVDEVLHFPYLVPISSLPITTYWEPHNIVAGVYIIRLEIDGLGEVQRKLIYLTQQATGTRK